MKGNFTLGALFLLVATPAIAEGTASTSCNALEEARSFATTAINELFQQAQTETKAGALQPTKVGVEELFPFLTYEDPKGVEVRIRLKLRNLQELGTYLLTPPHEVARRYAFFTAYDQANQTGVHFLKAFQRALAAKLGRRDLEGQYPLPAEPLAELFCSELE